MSDAPATQAPMVPCPSCRALTRFAPDNPWRPFCSQRCRSVDLGAWASERYRVAGKPPADEDAGTGD